MSDSNEAKIFQIAPAPSFSFKDGVSTATIYMAHYERLEAVAAAVRSGDRLLMKLAIDHLDRLGISGER